MLARANYGSSWGCGWLSECERWMQARVQVGSVGASEKDNKIYKHSDCLLRLRADYERASGSFYSASLKLVQWVSWIWTPFYKLNGRLQRLKLIGIKYGRKTRRGTEKDFSDNYSLACHDFKSGSVFPLEKLTMENETMEN